MLLESSFDMHRQSQCAVSEGNKNEKKNQKIVFWLLKRRFLTLILILPREITDAQTHTDNNTTTISYLFPLQGFKIKKKKQNQLIYLAKDKMYFPESFNPDFFNL